MAFLQFVRWEWKLQVRGLRFRVGALLYLAACALPSATLFVAARRDPALAYRSVDYLLWTVLIQGLLTSVFCLLLVGHRSGPGPREERLSVLGSAALSSAGYQLRRWAALAALVIPLAVLPLAVAALVASAAGAPPQEPTRWLVTFALFVVAPAVLALGAWLTLVSLGGGELMAVILCLLLVRVFDVAFDRTRSLLGWSLELEFDVFGADRFAWVVFLVEDVLQPDQNRFGELILSAGAFDPALAFAQWWPGVAPVAALCVALGLLSPLWLRRSRRDARPLDLGDDHALRATLPRIYGFVLRFVPDAGLRREWIAAGAALGVVCLAWIGLRARGDEFLELAERRYDAEILGEELPVTSPGLRTSEWSARGVLDQGARTVDLRWRARVEVVGAVEASHLSFTLDPFLQVSDLSLAGDLAGRTVHPERQWDRWILRLEPPLRAGEGGTLTARVHGAPATVAWDLGQWRNPHRSFVTRYRGVVQRGISAPVAESYVRPALGPRSIRLAPGMLGPVPRYGTWALTPPPVVVGDRGSEVPPETERVPARLALDLRLVGSAAEAPVLASSCGGLATGGRLVDGCLLPPHEMELVGGPFVVLDPATDGQPVSASTSAEEVRVAVTALPAHRRRLADLTPTFRRLLASSHRAWPGHPGIDRLVVMEWPGDFHLNPTGRSYAGPRREAPRIAGHLIAVPEAYVSHELDLELEPLLGEVLAADLFARREVAKKDRRALRAFLGGLMMRRMGAGRESATIFGRPWVLGSYRQPIRELNRWNERMLLYGKIPALLVELEARLGLDVMVAAMAEFLAPDDPQAPAGTAEELFRLLAEHGAGRPGAEGLERFLHEHWEEGVLPVVELESVEAVPVLGGWRVAGRAVNLHTGHARCPVVVRTEGANVEQLVTLPPRGGADFEIFVEARPHTVLVDPLGRCVRQARSPETPSTRARLETR